MLYPLPSGSGSAPTAAGACPPALLLRTDLPIRRFVQLRQPAAVYMRRAVSKWFKQTFTNFSFLRPLHNTEKYFFSLPFKKMFVFQPLPHHHSCLKARTHVPIVGQKALADDRSADCRLVSMMPPTADSAHSAEKNLSCKH